MRHYQWNLSENYLNSDMRNYISNIAAELWRRDILPSDIHDESRDSIRKIRFFDFLRSRNDVLKININSIETLHALLCFTWELARNYFDENSSSENLVFDNWNRNEYVILKSWFGSTIDLKKILRDLLVVMRCIKKINNSYFTDQI